MSVFLFGSIMAHIAIVVLAFMTGIFRVAAEPEIVKADPKDFTSLVSIRVIEGHQCLGVIFNSEHIITTALCVDGDEVKDLSVVLLPPNTVAVDIIKVTSIFEHEKYKFLQLNDDISLLKLAAPLNPKESLTTLSNPGPTEMDTEATIYGGLGHYPQGGKLTPRKFKVKILNSTQCCEELSTHNITMPPNAICAGGGESFCKTDRKPEIYKGQVFGSFGDALVVDNKVVGLMSLVPCIFPNTPGVFTLISEYYSWMEGKVKLASGAPAPGPAPEPGAEPAPEPVPAPE